MTQCFERAEMRKVRSVNKKAHYMYVNLAITLKFLDIHQ